MRSSREALVLFLCAVLGACVMETEPEEEPNLEELSCPPDSVLSYESFGAPFMATWCTTCHSSALPEAERAGAPLGVDFDSLEAIRARADRVWARAAGHNNTMPPVAGPSEDDRLLLGEWLACGAPSEAELSD